MVPLVPAGSTRTTASSSEQNPRIPVVLAVAGAGAGRGRKHLVPALGSGRADLPLSGCGGISFERKHFSPGTRPGLEGTSFEFLQNCETRPTASVSRCLPNLRRAPAEASELLAMWALECGRSAVRQLLWPERASPFPPYFPFLLIAVERPGAALLPLFPAASVPSPSAAILRKHSS